MAFLNCELTKEETDAVCAIRNSYFYWSDAGDLGDGTVDRENKVWFVKAHEMKKRIINDSWKVKQFFLYLGEISRENEVELFMELVDYNNESELAKKYQVESILSWKVHKLNTRIDISIDKLMEILTKVMQAYGVSGGKDENDSEYQKKFKTIIYIDK